MKKDSEVVLLWDVLSVVAEEVEHQDPDDVLGALEVRESNL